MEQYATGEAGGVFESITIPVVSISAKLWPTNQDGNKKHIQACNFWILKRQAISNAGEANRIQRDC